MLHPPLPLYSGHVNFSDEVTAGIRLSDGIVLFIDAAEGVSRPARPSSCRGGVFFLFFFLILSSHLVILRFKDGIEYSDAPVSHRDSRQSWASVHCCMRERAESAFTLPCDST